MTNHAFHTTWKNQRLTWLALAAFCCVLSVFTRWDFAGIASVSSLVSGVALAAVLIGGTRYLTATLCGVFIAHLFHNDVWWLACSEGLGAVLTALLGAWLVKRNSQFDISLGTWRDYIQLLFRGALLAPFAGFILTVVTLLLAGHSQAYTLVVSAQSWMRDTLGVVLITPLILACWPSPSNLRSPPTIQTLKESLVILTVSGLACGVIFLDWGHAYFAATTGLQPDLILKAYWMFLFIVWTAVRLGLRGVGIAVLLVAWIAVTGITNNVGFFSESSVPHYASVNANTVQNTQILSYWFFILCLSLVGSILASYVETGNKLIAGLNARDKTATLEFRHVMDTLDQHAIITTTDVQGCITSVNDKLCQVSGYSREELLGQDHNILNSGEHPSEFFKDMYLTIAKGQTWHGEVCNRTKDGQLYWLQTTISALMGPGGKPLSYLAIRTDVTSLHLHQKELELLSACLSHTNDVVLITEAEPLDSPGPRILFVNDAFERVTGYAREEAMALSPRILQGEKTDRATLERIRTALTAWQPVRAELLNYTKDGREFWVELDITPIADQSGWYTHWIAIQRDISDRKKAEAELHQLAYYDPLTGLPNRRLLTDRLARTEAQFRKDSQISALLYLDLDHFKTLNDTQGPALGDSLLCQVAERLINIAQATDTVARVGGDKFVVVLTALGKNLHEAAMRAETYGNVILAELNQPVMLGPIQHHNSVSIGVSLLNERDRYGEGLGQAEIAMYEAKKAGRKALRFFDPLMQVAINARSNLVNAMRRALEREEFQLHYQIQVNGDYSPIGAEALIRWDNPDLGPIYPDQFIPVAEETGLIIELGEWVLNKACAQIKTWSQQASTRDMLLSVNISVKQIMHADFEKMVKTAVLKTGINPASLMLELTESIFIEDTEVLIAKMRALKNIGIRLSLDDFGTGYSALQYLKRLPLDQIKIDQSFVRNLETDLYDKSIVLAIITMAKTLNFTLIAEGVETETQKQLLLEGGCTEFQGYLFGRPIPVEQFDASLLAA